MNFKGVYCFKKSFIAVLALLSVAGILYSSENNDSIKDKQQSNSGSTDMEQFDKFRVNNVSITKRVDDRIWFTLDANAIIHRKRISRGIIEYQNLKEIYMSEININFYPAGEFSMLQGRDSNIVLPLQDIGSNLLALGGSQIPEENILYNQADIDLDLLTRILMDDLHITVTLKDEKKLIIKAKTARMNTDFSDLFFENTVTLIDTSQKEFHATQAIWTKKLNGIYFPDGYILKSHYHKEKAFFSVNQEGTLKKLTKLPEIHYADVIEEKEELFYRYLFEKAPLYTRLMFGVMQRDN